MISTTTFRIVNLVHQNKVSDEQRYTVVNVKYDFALRVFTSTTKMLHVKYLFYNRFTNERKQVLLQ